MSENIGVGYRPAQDGFCMACGSSRGLILHILVQGWQTRFCDECFDQVIAEVKRRRQRAVPTMRRIGQRSPIPLKELQEAMEKDFRQQMIDSLTPDRGYGFPTDNVYALVAKYWLNKK